MDVDGVVVPVKDHGFAGYLSRVHGITEDETRHFFEGPFIDCLVGSKDLIEQLPPYLMEWNWEGTVEQFVNEWFETESGINASLLSITAKLRRAGVKIHLATNQEVHRLDYLKNVLHLENQFDSIFSSCTLGYLKPDSLYFDSIIADLGCKRSDMLLWDDRLENVQKARDSGVPAELFTDNNKFLAFMRKIFPEII